MNSIDLIVIGVLGLYAWSGWRRGFLLLILDFIGFLVSLAIPTFLHRYGSVILDHFGMDNKISPAISFIILFAAAQFGLWFALRSIYALIPKVAKQSSINRILGMIPALLKGFILCSLVLMLMVVLPMRVPQKLVSDSLVGSQMLGIASAIREAAAPLFTTAIREGMKFITIEPKSGESIKIAKQSEDLTIDWVSENKMLKMLNAERVKRRLKPLKMDEKLRALARVHSRDMFQRGYFAHVNPDGKDPFQRMRKFGIKYHEAGENLAMAPTLPIAHQGLMKSPGHRANILDPRFNRIGIGVYSSDISGKMFTQEFTD